jgi:single-stranded-DNA-specific exonuclease
MQKQTNKLQWKTKHVSDFSKETNFLETVLIDNGVKPEEIKSFLRPLKKHTFDPFKMMNMDKAVALVHKHIKNNSKIFVKVDPDVDGFTSSSVLIQFLKEVNPSIEIEYKLNYEKKHGLTFSDVANYTKDYFGLMIIPDASMTVPDARMITNNFSADILVLDHHIIENEFFDKERQKWINREEAKEVYKINKDRIEVDTYLNYCVAINCTDGVYPNPHLSGVGVVQKFIEAYLNKYAEEDGLDEDLVDQYLDLVSLGINADGVDLQSLESRYYVLEGMKERNYKNEFLNELTDRFSEDMKWGRHITSMSWNIAPKINGAIRYGKEDEQIDTFRAMLGEQEDREYQPRRKSKNDPKPPVEIHSLQKTMARVAENIKSRQDNEVRKFVAELEQEIVEKNLDKNSVLFIDGTKVLTKGTVTGLVANKLASKYFRPVVLLRSKDAFEYGGSCRGYDKGTIASIKDFLAEAGVDTRGHSNAAGVFLRKDALDSVIKKCNEMLPVDQLCTIHTVDWEIPATKLKREYVQEVAENYAVFGSTVPEPLFAITDLKINASKIAGYGENNNFIRFVHNGIVYVKKYCSASEFDIMTMRDRGILGTNKKNLKLNIIGQFVLNSWEDKINPEVKILYFDVCEDTEAVVEEEKPKQKKKVLDDDFDW